jgi:uncharacterized protein YkwD
MSLRALGAGAAVAASCALISAPAPAGARSTTPDPAPASCPDAELRPDRANGARIERAVLCLIGAERRAAGLGPLAPSPRLGRAARRHVDDMLEHRFLAHRRRGGPDLAERLRAVGYGGRGAETIMVGTGRLATPEATVRGWMASPRHSVVLLRSRYVAAGVAVQPRSPVRVAGRPATYTAVLGTER